MQVYPVDRINRGETLMISDEHQRVYIRRESRDDATPPYAVRCILNADEEAAIARREAPPYEEKRYLSLMDALLSLLEHQWLPK